MPGNDPAGIRARSLSADTYGRAPAALFALCETLFLLLDFGVELLDVQKGPWELASPRKLKLRRGLISPSRRSERNSMRFP